MHILTTSTEEQSINLVTRRANQGVVSILLYDKSARREINYNTEYYWQTTDLFFNEVNEYWNQSPQLSYTYGDVFSTLSGVFNLKENQYYSIKLLDGEGELYRGIIFCTNQTDYNKFDVHKDDYVVEDSYDNEYVIL